MQYTLRHTLTAFALVLPLAIVGCDAGDPGSGGHSSFSNATIDGSVTSLKTPLALNTSVFVFSPGSNQDSETATVTLEDTQFNNTFILDIDLAVAANAPIIPKNLDSLLPPFTGAWARIDAFWGNSNTNACRAGSRYVLSILHSGSEDERAHVNFGTPKTECFEKNEQPVLRITATSLADAYEHGNGPESAMASTSNADLREIDGNSQSMVNM